MKRDFMEKSLNMKGFVKNKCLKAFYTEGSPILFLSKKCLFFDIIAYFCSKRNKIWQQQQQYFLRKRDLEFLMTLYGKF